MDSLMSISVEANTVGHDNINAIIQSNQIWVDGCYAISGAMFAAGQSQLDRTVATWKAMGAVKSVREALAVQADFARASFASGRAETEKTARESMKLAAQVVAPLSARFSFVAGRFSVPAV